MSDCAVENGQDLRNSEANDSLRWYNALHGMQIVATLNYYPALLVDHCKFCINDFLANWWWHWIYNFFFMYKGKCKLKLVQVDLFLSLLECRNGLYYMQKVVFYFWFDKLKLLNTMNIIPAFVFVSFFIYKRTYAILSTIR